MTLPSYPSALTTTDHADPGVCVFHPSVPISAAPCTVCMAASFPTVRGTAEPIVTGDSGGTLVIKASSAEAGVFFLHGGFTAPTGIEEGDQANDNRE